jgi:molybdopterin converting factor small subunit
LPIENNPHVISLKSIDENWDLSKHNNSQEVIMRVNLKCFASLVNLDKCDYKDSTEYKLNNGQTIEDLLQFAEISKEDVKIAFVNNRVVDFQTVLSDGDQVGLAPAVGGM